MLCIRCGAPIGEWARFCPSCGAKLPDYPAGQPHPSGIFFEELTPDGLSKTGPRATAPTGYYLQVAQQTLGPFAVEQLHWMLAAGQIAASTPVWAADWPDWGTTGAVIAAHGLPLPAGAQALPYLTPPTMAPGWHGGTSVPRSSEPADHEVDESEGPTCPTCHSDNVQLLSVHRQSRRGGGGGGCIVCLLLVIILLIAPGLVVLLGLVSGAVIYAYRVPLGIAAAVVVSVGLLFGHAQRNTWICTACGRRFRPSR